MKNIRNFFILVIIILISGCGKVKPAADQVENMNKAQNQDAEPRQLTEAEKKIYATTTLYFIETFTAADVSQCAENLKMNMLTRVNQLLLRTCKKVFKSCLMEGTCAVSVKGKMQLINVDGVVQGVRRFRNITGGKCRFGRGATRGLFKNYSEVCIDPFYSVAADLKIYNLGDVIYLPAVQGTELPNGEIHDGYFIVRDTGGNIKGHGRFDFFTGFFGTQNTQNGFVKLKLNDKKLFPEYFVIEGAEAESFRLKRNFPLLPVGF